MAYYQNNGRALIRKQWALARETIIDPEALEIGDELVMKYRPTYNELLTYFNILKDAPRSKLVDFSLKI